jgi:hypothetical protein
MSNKTQHINLKIEQHESRENPGVNSSAPEGQAVPIPLVAPVLLLLNDTNIMRYENRIGHQYA